LPINVFAIINDVKFGSSKVQKDVQFVRDSIRFVCFVRLVWRSKYNIVTTTTLLSRPIRTNFSKASLGFVKHFYTRRLKRLMFVTRGKQLSITVLLLRRSLLFRTYFPSFRIGENGFIVSLTSDLETTSFSLPIKADILKRLPSHRRS